MPPAGEKAWIQFEFREPGGDSRRVTRDRRASSGPSARRLPGPDLEASDDGQTFRKVANIPRSTAEQNTVSFAPVSGTLLPGGVRDAAAAVRRERHRPPAAPAAVNEHQIAELVLHTGARVNRFEEKAAFAPSHGLSDMPTPHVAPADAVHKSDVIDLTSKMRPDGVARLDAAARQVGRAALGLLVARRDEPSRLARRHRASRWTS